MIRTVATYKPIVVVAAAIIAEGMTALPIHTVGNEGMEEKEETKGAVTEDKGAS